MKKILLCGICALVLGLLLISTAQAKGVADTQIKPLSTFSGSVTDEAMQEKIPVLITDVMALRDIWKNWAIKKEMPKVDFAKEIIVISTTRGSILQQEICLTGKGDLQISATSTKDLRDGFRYIISQVSLAGVTTIAGKELPKQRAVEPLLVVKGGTEDENIAYPKEKVITDAETMSALWKSWKQKEELPTIDFNKQFVLLTATSGSIIYPSYTISRTGELVEMSIATMDLLPGFRFVLVVFNREGVVKVNGQPLPVLMTEIED